MKLLEAYIKRIVAEQHSNDNDDIIQAIIKKFPAEYVLVAFTFDPAHAYAHTHARADVLSWALTTGKQDAFQQKYNADKAFRKLVNKTYCYSKQAYFDLWLNSLELREFLREDLKSAELILIERNKASAVSIKDVSAALEIAESVEEFIEMVKASL